MPANTVIPPPPRRTSDPRGTGDAQADLAALRDDFNALHDWAHSFHHSAVVEARLLDPSHQATPGTFDPDNLPDPTDTSTANAQDVANRAYALALSLVP